MLVLQRIRSAILSVYHLWLRAYQRLRSREAKGFLVIGTIALPLLVCLYLGVVMERGGRQVGLLSTLTPRPSATATAAPTNTATTAPTDTPAPTVPTVTSVPTLPPVPTANPGPPTIVPPTAVPAFIPAVGQEVHLVSTADNVLVATTDAAWDAMYKAIAANDKEGLALLVLSGDVLLVPVNTKVRVIEGAFTSVKVRMLEGAYYGQAGWVATELVGP